jgi:hypothetical protein
LPMAIPPGMTVTRFADLPIRELVCPLTRFPLMHRRRGSSTVF